MTLLTNSKSSLAEHKMHTSKTIPYFLTDHFFSKLYTEESKENNKYSYDTGKRSNNISPSRSNNTKKNRSKSRNNHDKNIDHNFNYYTITGRNQQNSRQFYKFHYQQIGTFLTQYKIRENYKFLQMISVPPLDPAVPKPEGGVSVPACGEPLLVPSSFPQSIEAAIHKFANSSSKATCIRYVF